MQYAMTTMYRCLGTFSQFLPWKEAEWKTSKDIFLTTPNRVRKASDFITCKKNLEFCGLSHLCLVYILCAANRTLIVCIVCLCKYKENKKSYLYIWRTSKFLVVCLLQIYWSLEIITVGAQSIARGRQNLELSIFVKIL